MYKLSFLIVSVFLASAYNPKPASELRQSDLTKDIELVTTKGTMVIRLSDSTPLHRDNFLKLVKQHYYDGILFHRVINQFMIQAGDPNSKNAKPGEALGQGGPGYFVPAEFRASLFHKKGALAAARTGDDINPARESNGSQFYLVHGKVYSDEELDHIEQTRLNGYKLPQPHREVYKTLGGVPSLDQKYTVFGEVISGLAVIDSIAVMPTGERNRPVEDVRIIKATLVSR